MRRAAPAADRFRVCPPGQTRGIDVQRFYPEIEALVRSKFQGAAVDIDDLVQETAIAISRKNTSLASAYDPSKASMGKYVLLVARSKLGHMLGGAARRERGVVYEDGEVLAARTPEPDAEAGLVEATPGTVGDVVEQLVELRDDAQQRARATQRAGRDLDARYQEGAADGLRAAAELISTVFDATAVPPLPHRVTALLAVAGGMLTAGQLSAGLLVPVGDVERALAELGDRVRSNDGGRYQLAPLFDEGDEVVDEPMRAPTAAAWARVKRTLTRALARWERDARINATT